MKRAGLVLAAFLGAGVTVYLVFSVGFAPVLGAITAVGWRGFAVLCAMSAALITLLSAGWVILLPGNRAKRWSTFVWGRAVRDSAGDILPLSQFGGFVIGARAVALRGVAAADAYASTIVDITTEMMAEIAFVVVGATIFVEHLGLRATHSHYFVPLLFGPILAALGAAGFIVVQHRGPAIAEKLAGRVLPPAIGHAGAFARCIREIYSTPLRVVGSTATHFLGWMASAFISWITVRLIGAHMSFLAMVAIESALSAIKSAAVAVPSAMGVQEASYAMLMPLYGVGPEIGLALSLLKRAASIAIGVPVLLSWQGLEGRHALAIEPRAKPLSEN